MLPSAVCILSITSNRDVTVGVEEAEGLLHMSLFGCKAVPADSILKATENMFTLYPQRSKTITTKPQYPQSTVVSWATSQLVNLPLTCLAWCRRRHQFIVLSKCVLIRPPYPRFSEGEVGN